jgi:hypothetical protein
LRPRRGDTPSEARLPRRRGRGEAAEQEPERRSNGRDAEEEPIRSVDDDSLRPLARALLALAEQLRREEGS